MQDCWLREINCWKCGEKILWSWAFGARPGRRRALKIDVDEGKASALGVALADINSTLQTSLGSSYVNNFINGNRVQRVIVQLDAPFRMSPDDVKNIYVRNRTGTMVPLSAFTTVKWIYGSPQLQNYNGFRPTNSSARPFPKSTGEAMDAMEKMVRQLPSGIGLEWTGQSYEERLSGSQAPMLYSLSSARRVSLSFRAV